MPEDTLHTWRGQPSREQLVAEVRTQREHIAALEEALHALVDGGQPVVVEGFDMPNGPSCVYCGGDDWDQEQRDVTHKPDCPVAKARALLGKKVDG